jgi:serine/threonine-protein kinase RsbW
MTQPPSEQEQSILGRVKRTEFVGRLGELNRLVTHGRSATAANGVLILAKPFAGVSELLRQTFDGLFYDDNVAPIYFELPQSETTPVSAAIEFLNTFLRHYLAHRRREPQLCNASMTLNDLRDLAPAADAEWILPLIDAYNEQRFGEDDRELVRFCFSAARRASHQVQPFILFDATNLASYDEGALPFARELFGTLAASGFPFVLAGHRRELLTALQRAGVNADGFERMPLDALANESARSLINSFANRHSLTVSDETEELLVQQLESSPYLITSVLQAAREKRIALDSYFDCERLYVDEVLGGKLYRQFSLILENIAWQPETRWSLIRLLCETLPEGKRSHSLESWARALKLTTAETEAIVRQLHIHELVNWDGETITLAGMSVVWQDYLRARFRLDALREPRALVVADLMAGALKRAPQTIAHYYRRAASLSLVELLNRFDTQLVPRKLFHYDEFAALYKGADYEEISVGLNADPDLVRLPQVFHAASGVAFSSALARFGAENSAMGHAFVDATYTDQEETVWLVAKVESKLEADAGLVEKWLSLLSAVARQSGFKKTQIWLIANEGFATDACALLQQHSAFGSSRQQFQILSSHLRKAVDKHIVEDTEDDFVLILPMDSDNELLAATTVEQVARRLNFSAEAINQIKTAVVEACINASEHSLSPDRKIYQRFRVENDKLVITISSRGVLPASLTSASEDHLTSDRRGWGLKLIRTLMDEVEFEHVDEGTRLRMTKYRRPAAMAEGRS